MIDKHNEVKVLLFSMEFLLKAKEVNQMYNAMLDAFKEEAEKGKTDGITYDEFKTWIDNELEKCNKIWNEQIEMFNNGVSEEERKAYVEQRTMEEVLKGLDYEI